ncbi:putative late transcription factor [Diachasmimorpha longicaudata entomopoxvirus]|uniref:Putative late transcription factor n=1 Tax=Diachasmimorpha longicaudata entomopoxvirus TaxID=109981 RepID=A0A7R5WM91_9POXV|nr:putative late transcription factor [Diachasmimorpha longicaudata entomopoxvirus]AKS26439.1 putative late transcription factor [Diachasmimorpha longicaudata entomopoxvirus]
MEEAYNFAYKQKILYNLLQEKMSKPYIYTEYDIEINQNSQYCWYCFKALQDKKFSTNFCSLMCQKILMSAKENNTHKINFVPFEILTAKSKIALKKIITELKPYDDLSLTYIYKKKNSNLLNVSAQLRTFNNFEDVEEFKDITLSTILYKKTPIETRKICLNCKSGLDGLTHKISEKLQGNYVIEPFCSDFCYLNFASNYSSQIPFKVKPFYNIPPIIQFKTPNIFHMLKKNNKPSSLWNIENETETHVKISQMFYHY